MWQRHSSPQKMKISVNSIARKVEVDNGIPLRHYFRIADSLLKQANIYREENNIVDLFIILLRFSSLISETMPFHQDYRTSLQKERAANKEKLRIVLDELESLKPEFQRWVDELNNLHAKSNLPEGSGLNKDMHNLVTLPLERPAVSKSFYSRRDFKQLQPAGLGSQSSWNNKNTHFVSSNSLLIDKHFQELSLVPPPKKETLSRHSFLGPNGLRGQWLGPSAEVKVKYPSTSYLIHAEDLSLDQAGHCELVALKNDDPGAVTSTMDSVLSLDDGRWSRPEESCSIVVSESTEDPLQLLNIRQPSPPPVLVQMHQEYAPIPPSKVADPRPGPAKCSEDSATGSATYRDIFISCQNDGRLFGFGSGKYPEEFRDMWGSCGGPEKQGFPYHCTYNPKAGVNFRLATEHLIAYIFQCQTLNEEEIFEVQDSLSLFPLGWIHTHPSQTCFMSSVDLHTHYSYQIMLPEAIAIVMAPTDTTSPHGIFHLSDPSGVSVIHHCQERGFHPHEEPSDGSSIYEHCSHVYMNPNMRFDLVDLRDR